MSYESRLATRVKKAKALLVSRKRRKVKQPYILAARHRWHVLAHRLRIYRRNTFKPWMLNGHPGNITKACKDIIVLGVRAGLVVTATTDGRHTATSLHYVGKAVDFGSRTGGETTKKANFQRSLYRRGHEHYRELFGPDNYFNVKNGGRVSLGEGTPLETLHDTHVHVSPY